MSSDERTGALTKERMEMTNETAATGISMSEKLYAEFGEHFEHEQEVFRQALNP